MPKRIVDGDAIATSRKLASLKPPLLWKEYPYLLTLALANGVFDCDPRLIWSRYYSFLQPELTPDKITIILDEFERVGLLGRWTEKDGKTWGYWIGIHKSGRLPAQNRLVRGQASVGPAIPRELAIKWQALEASEVIPSGPLSFSGEKLKITLANDKRLRSAFDWLDIESQYKAMDLWMVANPAKQRTDHFRFALNWLRKAAKDNPRPKTMAEQYADLERRRNS